jgi:hypothetical protein
MKKVTFLLLAGLILFVGGDLSAQKLKSGSFTALKGQTVINLQYDYSGMAVGKFDKEQDYINKRVADMNKKEAGTGDKWAQAWVADRDSRFHPMFEKNLNLKLDAVGAVGKQNATDAKYTLIIRTLFTEPGYNIGISRQNAYINMMVDLIETANPGTVLGSVELKNVQSVYMGGYDFDTGSRIQSCYDRAGDWLGNFLLKNALK